jgi:putative transposase
MPSGGCIGESIEREPCRAALNKRVCGLFERSKRTYGSPRIHTYLHAEDWLVSVNIAADSMRRQELVGENPRGAKDWPSRTETPPKIPDLLRRDFNVATPNHKWCGGISEIPTDEGNLFSLCCWTCADAALWSRTFDCRP